MISSNLSARFRIATRDEVWVVEDGRIQVIQSRLAHGEADFDGAVVHARDRAHDPLLRACEGKFERDAAHLRDVVVGCPGLSVRTAVSVREASGVQRDETIVECSIGGLSVITTPAYAASDVAALLSYARLTRTAVAPENAPIVWCQGTSAVLLHEAAGHASESGSTPMSWPVWLRAVDAPLAVIDDLGAKTRTVDLLRGETPSSSRRETFRDLPLARMSRVVVSQVDAPPIHAIERIEVHLIAGGSYDPLTGQVSVQVTVARACALDGSAVWLRPFALRRSRLEIAQAIRGASGQPVRYPGVICSREGQDVYVESHGCDLLTVFE